MRNAMPRPWTVDEFLEWERAQEERYEYVDGIIRMMTGGTLDHARIKGNIYAALRRMLRGSACSAFVDGPKVASADAIMYPDAVVTCARELPPKSDIVPEPVVVVEVLSKSTEGFDRSGKWRAYQSIPSLRRYLLVSQSETRIEVFSRGEGVWTYTVFTRAEDLLPFPEFRAEVSLAEVYEDTSLDARRSTET
jgi:Uma2 family endonuclease